MRWSWCALAGLSAARAREVTLLVRSQDTPHDRALLSGLTAAVTDAGWSHLSVVGMAEAERELGHRGLWTYKPWIFRLEEQRRRSGRRAADGQRWVVFLEPATAVDASQLGALLDSYDSRDPVYLGHPLRDAESSIVHHYSTGPAYPHAHAGFALSDALLQRLASDLRERPLGSDQQIEPVWEVANWIKKLGVDLTDRSDVLCLERRPGCATWVTRRDHHRASRGVAPQDVVIGVKTVGKFHAERIPYIHDFWGASSSVEVLYLSNEGYAGVPGAKVVDLSLEFASLVDPARESTKQGTGHCAKMEAILRYFMRHQPGRRWYAVTDDDTLLNVPRLLAVLGSHDSRGAVYLGERYGWAHREGREGTNYVTTGGGMVLSQAALAKLESCSFCTCRAPDDPDDMTLGTWFSRLGVPVVHEEGFHQAEPHNYHPEVLRHADAPISFHRFGMRLPGSAPWEQKDAARRGNWGRWVRSYFKAPAGENQEL